MEKKQSWQFFLQGFILFNGLWWLAAKLMETKALPNPIDVYIALPTLLEQGIGIHLSVSLKRLGLGLMFALIIGGSIGILMGKVDYINRLLSPLVYFTYPIPKTALLPIIMILCGLGDISKITLIVLITVFPIMIAVRDSILQMDESLEHVLISLGANSLQRMWYVTLPAILPQLLTQLRLSVGTALSVLFFAENYGTNLGLGYYVQDYWSRMNYTYMYAGILLLSLLGCLLIALIDLLEKMLCKGN